MKIPHKVYLKCDKSEVRNLLYQFGYLVISDFWSDQDLDVLKKEFNYAFVDKYGYRAKPSEKFFKTWIIESSPHLFDRMFRDLESLESSFLSLVDDLTDCRSYYGFSSVETFASGTPWHRDCFIASPVFKFATYFYDSDASNSLCVFPGSHSSSDFFAQRFNSWCKWPEGGGPSQRFSGFDCQ